MSDTGDQDLFFSTIELIIQVEKNRIIRLQAEKRIIDHHKVIIIKKLERSSQPSISHFWLIAHLCAPKV
jgi:hypothetical protein